MKINVVWLYHDLMDTYGDKGNILTLLRRLEWRGVKTELTEISLGEAIPKDTNILFLGGAQDRQQRLVMPDLMGRREEINDYILNGGVGLFVCAGYQLMGNFYQDADGSRIEGLKIFDLETINPGISHPRLIGNAVIKCPFLGEREYLVGFENHGGRTFLKGSMDCLGRVVAGFGNNGRDKTEGARFKNAIGTYLHGPVLPKNPKFADYLLGLAIDRIEPDFELTSLSDILENRVHNELLNKLKVR